MKEKKTIVYLKNLDAEIEAFIKDLHEIAKTHKNKNVCVFASTYAEKHFDKIDKYLDAYLQYVKSSFSRHGWEVRFSDTKNPTANSSVVVPLSLKHRCQIMKFWDWVDEQE